MFPYQFHCHKVLLAATGIWAVINSLNPLLASSSEWPIVEARLNRPTQNNSSHNNSQPYLSRQISQTPEPQCFTIRQQVGLYQEPNRSRQALGVLPAGMQIQGTIFGQNWVRVIAPTVGWLDGTALQQVPGACNFQSANPVTSETVAVNTALTCTVTSSYGLAVRDQPVISYRNVVATLQPGDYPFQLTSRTTRTATGLGDREWAYIVSPAEGWISLGIAADGKSNLEGQNCPGS